MTLKEKIILCLATGFYIGKFPFFPGTMGSVAGLLLCWILFKSNLWVAFVFILAFIFIAVWIADNAEKILKQRDPGCIVIDEIAGVVVALFGLPFNMGIVVAGFFLFRLMDILKPFPIRWLERSLPGGFGVVLDDVAAGILSNLVLRIAIAIYQ